MRRIGHSQQFPLGFERGPASHRVQKKEGVWIASRISDVINPEPGRLAHLPEIESVSVDVSKCMLVHFLYLFLQVVHRLIPPNRNREGSVGLRENPTEEVEIAI